MKTRLLIPFLLSALAATASAAPIRLHPDNPHYFEWRGKPTLLITSAEHYGAVLNGAFDYTRYLDTLAADGLNLTRTFTGAYCEPPGAFKITRNTLAPESGKLVAPWARADEEGYAGGGPKFDLDRWNDSYFVRLKDFVAQASKRGVVVELTLFCPFYKDDMWRLSPMNAANNVNGVGGIARTNVYTLDRHEGLLAVQEKLTRKIVGELREADNVMYEICNEPYFGGVTLEWQGRIADVIAKTEKRLGVRHLITQNIANRKARVDRPHPAVSVFNFHYANPPETVAMNWHLNRPIGDNETGFKGNADDHYRTEAWEFILAGGALYNNLDYSFTAGHEDGTFEYPKTQPGGGNPGFRSQIRFLKEFIHGFDFLRMKPSPELARGLPRKTRRQVLAATGRQYAGYFKGSGLASLKLELPSGQYRAEWFDVVSGAKAASKTIRHTGGAATVPGPADAGEFALRLVRDVAE